ncbi:MAG: hypothetical protein QNJ41_08345 [Xenococcaceae cyanobacterium MO_188.B32]|nr:hypothetical protein [Xenococcaceae cyanobacterium MO_188.B32]
MTSISSDRHNYSVILCLSIFIGLLTVSCSDTKYAQCEQIIQIANNVVNEKTKLIDTNNSTEEIESTTWLQAARTIAQAAQKLENIELQDPKLIKYQTDLAQIYRIYSRATYDAVRAWEHKNIKALQIAHTDAERAGQLEEKLGNVINNYCGDRQE